VLTTSGRNAKRSFKLIIINDFRLVANTNPDPQQSLNHFYQKLLVLSSRKYDLGCLLRIPDPAFGFFPFRIPAPGTMGQKNEDPDPHRLSLARAADPYPYLCGSECGLEILGSTMTDWDLLQILITLMSIRQGCGSGSAWISINLSCWIRIRIKIAKITPKKKKMTEFYVLKC
jgi:hypothetical protein